MRSGIFILSTVIRRAGHCAILIQKYYKWPFALRGGGHWPSQTRRRRGRRGQGWAESSLTRIIVEAGCTISLGGGGRGGLRWPEVAGLHLQRLTERPSRVGRSGGHRRPASERAPCSAETRRGGSRLEGRRGREAGAAVVSLGLAVHLMRNNNNELKSNKRLKS